MQNYSNDQLAAIKELASLFFSPREIAIMQELPVEEFINECMNEGSEAFRHFYSGRLQSEVDIRKAVIMLAKSGSSPAQTMAMDMIQKSFLKIMDK